MPDDHERLIRECYALARSAVEIGNHPFGALLAKDGEVILTAENTVHSDGDVTRHAELNLVSRAARELDPETLSQCTLYTSTETRRARRGLKFLLCSPCLCVSSHRSVG